MTEQEQASVTASPDSGARSSDGQDATGAASPRVIVGLGNPGARYADTRHNYGFFVVDELARRFGLKSEDVCSSDLFVRPGEPEVHLVKPLTFMNRSGMAVRCLAQRNEYLPANVLVVYDDISLPLGSQRMRGKGSAGGHRGLASVIENLRTDQVPRLRLGIATLPQDNVTEPNRSQAPSADLADFVLQPFSAEEQDMVSASVGWAADACEAWLRYGIAHTMNHFNGSLPDG